jgi:adenylate kinase
MNHVILLGKPCSGKGTLSKKLIEAGYYHLSGSDILRENSQDINAPFYKEAIAALTTGTLINDDIMNGMVSEKIKSLNGQPIVFDGFPRSISQTEKLFSLFSDLTQLSAFYLDIADDVILERVNNRLTCQSCATSYNKTALKPLKEGICDSCGGIVAQRKDDNSETLKTRLSEYNNQTAPVIDYMAKHVKFHNLTEEEQTVEFITIF